MSGKLSDLIVPLVLSLVVLNVLGAIIGALMKLRGRQKRMELLQRERIAAIERGIDPANLPDLQEPLSTTGGFDPSFAPGERDRRRAQSFTLAGILTLSIGVGGSLFFLVVEEHGEAWTIGIIPIFLGIALLICGRLVRRG
jgi:hypothetical protein